MKGLSQLMRQAQEMQANMQKAQNELAAIEVEGVAGGGMVKVVVTCKHEVRRVTIEDSLLRQPQSRADRAAEAVVGHRWHGPTGGSQAAVLAT
jgi:DNA-binding YbaB/EbfC family protein